MDSPYAQELKVAIGAVQRAARLSTHILASAQQQQDASSPSASQAPSQDEMGVVAKDDLSPVTVADFAIQALLTCTIHRAFPDDRFVGEESADALRANPALLARVWDALQHTRREQEQDHESAGDAALPSSPHPNGEAHFPATQDEMCDMIDWCGAGHPGAGGRIWVFDPIDGTENFVQGLVYAINAALLDGGRQALSVVGCPNLAPSVAYPAGDASLDPSGEGCLLLAARGSGAFVRPLRGDPAVTPCTRLADLAPASSSSSTSETAPAPLLLRSTSARNTSGLGDVHAEVARRLGVEWPGSVLLPWVLRWVLLAFGVGNATWWVYKERARLAKVWDHAGAMLLFEEVGGRVTDVDGADIDLTVNRKMTANYGFVAAPAAVHGKVLATVREVLQEQRPELLEKQT